MSDALRAEAKEMGISEIEILKQALEERLKQERTPDQSPMERYAGIVDGPHDLSTNKDYKKAWGKNAA